MDLILFKLVFTLAAGLVGYQAYRIWLQKHWDDVQPCRQLTVSVLDKRSQTEPSRIADKSHSYNKKESSRTNYYVTFEPIAGGPTQEFLVKKSFYDRINKGTCGTIHFQGHRFIDFIG